MLTRYTEKNSFGGYTWHIKLDSLFHIFLNETDKDSFVVEFKEWKWISYKTHFSFISNLSLEKTIEESIDKVFIFFKKSNNYSWTEEQKLISLNKTLSELISIRKNSL